jgi:hypothetical protein
MKWFPIFFIKMGHRHYMREADARNEDVKNQFPFDLRRIHGVYFAVQISP